MTSVDSTTTSSTSTTQITASESAGTSESQPTAEATVEPQVDTQANSAVDSASDGLKSALEETQQAAAQMAAAGKGENVGLSRVLEAVVSLVSSLVSLIGSMFAEKEASAQSSATSQTGTSQASANAASATSSGSASSTSATSSSSSSSGTEATNSSSPAVTSGLQALTDEKGVVTVRTPDGFVLKAEGKEQAWQIVGPEGRATRIWGDPHVTESDGKKWDFKDQSSFVFGSNKVTVETTPFGNGKTVSKRITVYSGNERVTIGGIDTNRPFIVGLANDGKQHDDSLSDGTTYRRGIGKTGESWAKKVGTGSQIM